MAQSAPSHHINQCYFILNWTLGNKSQWNLKQFIDVFIEGNASENVVCGVLAIVSWPHWVNEALVPAFSFYLLQRNDVIVNESLNSLFPCAKIWQHEWLWSTLDYIMASCLMTPSHTLNHCCTGVHLDSFLCSQSRENCVKYYGRR